MKRSPLKRSRPMARVKPLKKRSTSTKGARKRSDEKLLEENTPFLVERSNGQCEIRGPDCLCFIFDPESQEAVAFVKAHFSRHHRQMKSQGGTSELENLILACGSGTTGCHGYIHRLPANSRKAGWLIPSWVDPAKAPFVKSLGDGRLTWWNEEA